MDWLQTWGRLRSNKFMLDRKDVKGMIRNLKAGEILWYAPDHDYGPRKSVFAPLFAVDKAATTTGTYILVKTSHPRRKNLQHMAYFEWFRCCQFQCHSS